MPDQTPPGMTSTDTFVKMIRLVLVRLLLVSTAIMVVAAGIGYLIQAMPGLWAALIGAAISFVFTGATALSLYLVAGRNAQLMQIVLLGGWLIKMVVLIIVLAWLKGQGFYDKVVLFVTIVVVVMAALAVEVVTVLKSRIPTYDLDDVSHEAVADGSADEGEYGTPADGGDLGHGASQDRHDSPADPVD